MKPNALKYIVVLAMAMCIQLTSANVLRAQTDVDLDSEFGARLSATIDKKITRGLHVSLEEEVRMDNNFSSFERFHTTLGISYKVNDYLKVGAGYALINKWDSESSAFKSARHRFMVDATGSLRFGDWRLSLKERFQATYRSGDMNEYQNPRTALSLKSRLKLQYKGFRRIDPYAYVELRNTLNAPAIKATYNESTDTWGYYQNNTFYQKGGEGWFLDGFNSAYINRLRFALGFEYRIDRRSFIDICLMADRTMDKVVDANAEGTKLKAYTRETGFIGWISANYKYAF